jgi:ubiquitin-conjugating enzyme E2 Q
VRKLQIRKKTNIRPDTSEYPDTHNFICFAQDEDIPQYILDAIQGVSDAGPRSILNMFVKLLTSISKRGDTSDESNDEAMDDHDDESVDGVEFDDDFGDFGIIAAAPTDSINMDVLQR